MERKEIMKEIIDEKNNKIIGNINLDNSKVKFTVVIIFYISMMK